MSLLPIRSMIFLAARSLLAPGNGKGYVTGSLQQVIQEIGENGKRTSLSNMGANITRIGLTIQRDKDVDTLPVAMSELKATLNSSSLDCSELKS